MGSRGQSASRRQASKSPGGGQEAGGSVSKEEANRKLDAIAADGRPAANPDDDIIKNVFPVAGTGANQYMFNTDKGTIQTVDAVTLKTEQEWLERGKVRFFINTPEKATDPFTGQPLGDRESLPLVYRTANGSQIVLEGNHRAAAQKLLENRNMRALVVTDADLWPGNAVPG